MPGAILPSGGCVLGGVGVPSAVVWVSSVWVSSVVVPGALGGVGAIGVTVLGGGVGALGGVGAFGDGVRCPRW